MEWSSGVDNGRLSSGTVNNKGPPPTGEVSRTNMRMCVEPEKACWPTEQWPNISTDHNGQSKSLWSGTPRLTLIE